MKPDIATILDLTQASQFAEFNSTSLPFVSTAGRGAVLSGAAPAFFKGERLL